MHLDFGARGRICQRTEVHDEHETRRARRLATPERDVGQPDGAAAPIVFPQGLPGFPGATRFALRPLADAARRRCCCLQSADDPELRFLVLPYADQRGAAAPQRSRRRPVRRSGLQARQRGGAPGRDQPARAGARRATRQRLYVNLRAPLVLDTVRRTAVQHVLASPAYSVRHCLPRPRMARCFARPLATADRRGRRSSQRIDPAATLLRRRGAPTK